LSPATNRYQVAALPVYGVVMLDALAALGE
jgi:hypothetical protein